MSNEKVPVYTDNGEVYAYSADSAPVDVLGTTLTGFAATNAVVTASDTVLSSIGNLQGQITALPAQFTQAQVRSTPITGVVFTTATAIAAADTLLVAIGKLQAQITAQAKTIANQATTISGHTATIATLTTRLEALEGAADAG